MEYTKYLQNTEDTCEKRGRIGKDEKESSFEYNLINKKRLRGA